MTTSEIFHRLRIGLALVAGFITGKMAAITFPRHASEFFVGGYLAGYMLTRLLFRAIDLWLGKIERPNDEPANDV